jgi:enamine deaminase RidA (YjgF/YER057c/UK114 family)
MADTSTGSGTPADAGTGGQAPQGTQPPAAPPAQQQPTGQAPATQPPADTKTDLSTLPPDVRKMIADANAEAAKYRTEGRTAAQQAQAAAQQRDAILKALGLTPDGSDAPPDPEALAAQVTEQQAITWETAAENAILRVAGAAGADADALLDSNAFLDSLGDFIKDDPKSGEFRTKLQAHIAAWVDKHPKHKTAAATSTATRSGGDHPGGTGSPSARPKSLHAAVAKAYGGK